MSHGQRSLWFLYRLAPESAAYNVFGAVRILDELDVDALRRAFETLAERHDVLRTTFEEREGEPVRRVSERGFRRFPLRGCGVVERTSPPRAPVRGRRIARSVWRPGRRCVCNCSSLSAREHVLLLAAHHIVVDFWSLGVLMHEPGELYDAEAGRALPLAPPASRYADYVRLAGASCSKANGARGCGLLASSNWRTSRPSLDLPTDLTRPPVADVTAARP